MCPSLIVYRLFMYEPPYRMGNLFYSGKTINYWNLPHFLKFGARNQYVPVHRKVFFPPLNQNRFPIRYYRRPSSSHSHCVRLRHISQCCGGRELAGGVCFQKKGRHAGTWAVRHISRNASLHTVHVTRNCPPMVLLSCRADV